MRGGTKKRDHNPSGSLKITRKGIPNKAEYIKGRNDSQIPGAVKERLLILSTEEKPDSGRCRSIQDS